jgi:diguanylate cyclase (GGDEF)-like protein
VVDDDLVTLRLVSAFFEADHEVESVPSAEAALEACARQPPDLLLLDIRMPDMDGLELCRRLKDDPWTQDIPVLFITSQDTPQEETEALLTGAVDFITKPLHGAVVRARVRTHLLLKAQADFMRHQALHDSLTGVANRRRFDQALEAEWRRCKRNGGSLGLVMCDLDEFKPYNDRYGHLAGDACLRAVALAMAGRLRRPMDLLARYGGEEFVCLLPETGLDGVRQVARDLCQAVRTLGIPHEGTRDGIVTASFGVAAVVPDNSTEVHGLVALADRMLYAAKAAGRDHVAG